MAILDKIPELSYGIFECAAGTLIFSIPALILSLLNVSIWVLFFYFIIIVFMILAFAAHIQSHDIASEMSGLINKAKATRKEIKKYAKKHEI